MGKFLCLCKFPVSGSCKESNFGLGWEEFFFFFFFLLFKCSSASHLEDEDKIALRLSADPSQEDLQASLSAHNEVLQCAPLGIHDEGMYLIPVSVLFSWFLRLYSC